MYCCSLQSVVSEQAIIHLLSALPIPITITPQVRERDGKPYYAYQVGEISEERPFGLCKGVTPDFLHAVRHSLAVAMNRGAKSTGQ